MNVNSKWTLKGGRQDEYRQKHGTLERREKKNYNNRNNKKIKDCLASKLQEDKDAEEDERQERMNVKSTQIHMRIQKGEKNVLESTEQ